MLPLITSISLISEFISQYLVRHDLRPNQSSNVLHKKFFDFLNNSIKIILSNILKSECLVTIRWRITDITLWFDVSW